MTQRFDDGDDTRVARAAMRVRARLDDASSCGRFFETPAGGFRTEPTPHEGRYRFWNPATGDAVMAWTVEAGCELHVVMRDDARTAGPPPG